MQYGEVVDIRFPSLKFNTHRRFCYIQYKLPSQARAATELDGQKLDGKLPITAKLSDPAHKQDRHGAMHEGRELYIANVDWSATKQEVKEAFSRFGEVENVRIPLKVGGGSKGIAFVIFADRVSCDANSRILAKAMILTFIQEAATKALEMNLTRFKSRVISVTPSTDDKGKRQATTIINPATSRSSFSPTPDPGNTNGLDTASAASPASQSSAAQTKTAMPSDRSSRTIALLNVPDTYTSDRVRVLAETYGALVKIQLRPDHQGAILEYVEAVSAGKAGLALDGYEIEAGRKLRVGTVAELFKEKPEFKSDKIGAPKKKDAPLQGTMTIRRPNQPGARRGGKGGLGFKRGGVAPNREGEGTAGGGPKSNADFKAMLLKE